MVRDDCTSGDIPGHMVEVTDLAMQHPTNGAIAAPCGPRAPFTVPRCDKAGISEYEVRTRHAVDTGQHDGEFSGAVGIRAAEKHVTGRIETQLPACVGAAEIRTADELERLVAAHSRFRIDGREIDLVLALGEVEDLVALRAADAAVGNGVD